MYRSLEATSPEPADASRDPDDLDNEPKDASKDTVAESRHSVIADVVPKLKHPARYTDSILEVIADCLKPLSLSAWVLAPSAVTGRIHELAYNRVGVELEPEWASMSEGTIIGDATALPSRMRASTGSTTNSRCCSGEPT